MSTHRIGLIVPSSNTTTETELPELFRRREAVAPERFTFHSARMRMTQVTPEALAGLRLPPRIPDAGRLLGEAGVAVGV